MSSNDSHDKQLSGITFEDVLKKRQHDQALNAKEFAVLAGISYSTARDWFRSPGFPVFRSVVFWSDFVNWRQNTYLVPQLVVSQHTSSVVGATLPRRAAQLLREV